MLGLLCVRISLSSFSLPAEVQAKNTRKEKKDLLRNTSPLSRKGLQKKAKKGRRNASREVVPGSLDLVAYCKSLQIFILSRSEVFIPCSVLWATHTKAEGNIAAQFPILSLTFYSLKRSRLCEQTSTSETVENKSNEGAQEYKLSR